MRTAVRDLKRDQTFWHGPTTSLRKAVNNAYVKDDIVTVVTVPVSSLQAKPPKESLEFGLYEVVEASTLEGDW